MKIWRFINSPFISALCTVVLLCLIMHVAARPLLESVVSFNNSNEAAGRVDALGRLQLLSFTEVANSEDGPQKFVGRVRNNSSTLITGVTAGVSFYDENKALADFFSTQLDGVKLLKPGEEMTLRSPGRITVAART